MLQVYGFSALGVLVKGYSALVNLLHSIHAVAASGGTVVWVSCSKSHVRV